MKRIKLAIILAIFTLMLLMPVATSASFYAFAGQSQLDSQGQVDSFYAFSGQ